MEHIYLHVNLLLKIYGNTNIYMRFYCFRFENVFLILYFIKNKMRILCKNMTQSTEERTNVRPDPHDG